MRNKYDFSQGVKNPYIKQVKATAITRKGKSLMSKKSTSTNSRLEMIDDRARAMSSDELELIVEKMRKQGPFKFPFEKALLELENGVEEQKKLDLERDIELEKMGTKLTREERAERRDILRFAIANQELSMRGEKVKLPQYVHDIMEDFEFGHYSPQEAMEKLKEAMANENEFKG